jgi:hypothetical protein
MIGEVKGSKMTNLQRLLVVFLLFAGWSLLGAQPADAQEQNTRSRIRVAAPQPDPAPEAGKDFSAGRRFGAILMNPLLGLGSYTMGDRAGGAIISGGYLLAGGLILWEIFGFDHEDEFAGIPGMAGLGVAGATTIFGILRPIFYHKRGSGSKAAAALDGANVEVILAAPSHAPEIRAVRLSYTFQF